MTVSLPYKIRIAIYVVASIGSLLIAYLNVKHYVGDAEMALWNGLAGLTTAMAASNVSPDSSK